MKRIKYFAPILFAVILFSGCVQEEKIVPTEITSMSRFDFPEGTNSYDLIFDQLHNEYDTRIIYKQWSNKDWEKSWIAGVVSSQYKVYGEHYTGADSLQKIAEFYKKAFSYLDKDIARKVFPQYIYIINNWRYDWGPIGIAYPQKNLEGLDFWLLSFPASAYMGTDTERNIRGARCSVVNAYLELAVRKGIYVQPDGFTNGVDYNTKIYNKIEYSADPNYYLTRGFCDIVNTAKFTATSPLGELGPPASTLGGSTIGSDFLAFLRIGMFYTEAEMNEHYAGYTLLLSRYQLVKNYMKTKYNIDLNAIASGS